MMLNACHLTFLKFDICYQIFSFVPFYKKSEEDYFIFQKKCQ